jgi:hypothetical protein
MEVPPWLSWQSVRLLTDRSSVRSREGAFFFFDITEQIQPTAEKKIQKEGGQGGFEPPTSRTQSENHTPRPLALFTCEARGIRTPNLRVWNPTRYRCAIASSTHIFLVPDMYKTKISNKD